MNRSFPFDVMNVKVNMERTIIIWKWIRVILLASLAILLAVMLYGAVGFAWLESRYGVASAYIDPRSLEHLELFYFAIHMSMLLSWFLTIAGLIRTLFPLK